MLNEIREHLKNGIIPFWEGLKDEEFGGYYGYMDYDLKLDKRLHLKQQDPLVLFQCQPY